MADAVETAELLDIDVYQVARLVTLIATHRLCWPKVLQPRQSGPLEHPAHRCRRDGDHTCNVLARKAQAPQRNDPIGHSPFGCMRTAPGPRRTVGHAGTAFGLVALDPSLHDLRRHRELQRCLGWGKAAFNDRKRHLLSTQRRETGILMNVHSGPPTNLKRDNSSLLGRARMDNLLKARI